MEEPAIRSACSPRTVSAWSVFLMPFLPFVYGYPSSSPRAHRTPNKSLPTLRYTRRHGQIYTGPCPKALTDCSPLDFRRSSIPICIKTTLVAIIWCTSLIWNHFSFISWICCIFVKMIHQLIYVFNLAFHNSQQFGLSILCVSSS